MNIGLHTMKALRPGRSTIPFSNRGRLDLGSEGTFARWRRGCQLALQRLAERHEIGIQRDAQVAQLNHIEAAHTALDIAHEVLHDAELRRKVFLPHPAPMAELAQQVAHALVFDPMDGFAHGRRRWERS